MLTGWKACAHDPHPFVQEAPTSLRASRKGQGIQPGPGRRPAAACVAAVITRHGYGRWPRLSPCTRESIWDVPDWHGFHRAQRPHHCASLMG